MMAIAGESWVSLFSPSIAFDAIPREPGRRQLHPPSVIALPAPSGLDNADSRSEGNVHFETSPSDRTRRIRAMFDANGPERICSHFDK